jgi:hypothetical protein
VQVDHSVDFVYLAVRYVLAGQLDKWRSKSNLRESLWADRRTHNYIELLAGNTQRRGCKLLLGRMGNIRSSEGSMAVGAVAADTEVVEAVELDTVAELVASMAQVLLGPGASVVSHEPWCIVYGV